MGEYDFIIKEPWLLDAYKMPALERELIIRLTNSRSGEVFPLKAAHGLMIETLEFYYEEGIPFSVEVHGINSGYRLNFVSLLTEALGVWKGRSTAISYRPSTVDYANGYFILTFKTVRAVDNHLIVDVEYVGQNYIPNAEVAMKIEILGYENIDGGHEYLGVLYDRKQQKHGFIRFTDVNYEPSKVIVVDLMALMEVEKDVFEDDDTEQTDITSFAESDVVGEETEEEEDY